MRFEETSLAGVYQVHAEPSVDDRGAFARLWCEREFANAGLDVRISQCSIATNRERGTLRGMHYQAAPHGETKLIRCTRGAVWDALIDLRPDSSTYRGWAGFELREGSGPMLYVPEGIAHGYISLENDTEMHYMINTPYVPEAARGVRWDDPAFRVEWPMEPVRISDRDRGFALFGS